MNESHPLFPAANEESDPPEVSTIHVTRIPDGTHYRAFQPEELTSYEQIYQMFGGGQYVLLARNGSHISGRTTVTLPGKSKPLNPAPEDVDDEPRQPIYAAPPQQQQASDPTMVLAMMQMMQANSAAMLQMMMKQSESQTQLMLAVMNQGSGASREYIQIMQGLHNQHSAEQAKLLQSVVEATRSQNAGAGAGGGEMGGFMRGVEFARQFATGGDDDSEIGEIFETMRPFLDGMGAAKKEDEEPSDD